MNDIKPQFCYHFDMLKTKPKSTSSATNGTNGNGRLPKASDYELPKRLSAKRKQAIDTSRAIFEEFRKVREEGRSSDKKAPTS